MATKIYFPSKNIEMMKNNFTQSNDYKFDIIPCVNSYTISGGIPKMVLIFTKNDNSGSVTFTTYWDNVSNNWVWELPTTSNNAPNRCYNKSQIVGNYSTASSLRFDYYELTDNFYYHPHFDSILVIFFIILIICIYFPYRIIARCFGRWLKV